MWWRDWPCGLVGNLQLDLHEPAFSLGELALAIELRVIVNAIEQAVTF